MSKIKFELTFDTVSKEITVINTDTGETAKAKAPTKKSTKALVDDGKGPTLTLEDSKYVLNKSAVDLLKVAPGDKLDIKYEKEGHDIRPIIGKNTTFGTQSGNRITKTYTVSCKGKPRIELSKYGDTFEILPHPIKEGLFLLKGNAIVNEEVKIPEDSGIEDLIEDPDATEVTSFDFNTIQ